MSFEIVDDDAEIYADINRRFAAYNRGYTDWGGETFSVVSRSFGRIDAAGRGVVNMGLVEIRGLWVDKGRRGKGTGQRLLTAIEAEARRRGCTRAALDTYSWQAEGFYRRMGYAPYGRLDYPNGTYRVFLVKDLQ